MLTQFCGEYAWKAATSNTWTEMGG